MTLAMEKEEWKPFCNALDKSDRKQFDEMWDIPRLYITACSNSVQLVPLHPIMISILFHHYKQLTELMTQAEQMSTKVEGLEKACLFSYDELSSLGRCTWSGPIFLAIPII
jgi:hypothetical protein